MDVLQLPNGNVSVLDDLIMGWTTDPYIGTGELRVVFEADIISTVVTRTAVTQDDVSDIEVQYKAD